VCVCVCVCVCVYVFEHTLFLLTQIAATLNLYITFVHNTLRPLKK